MTRPLPAGAQFNLLPGLRGPGVTFTGLASLFVHRAGARHLGHVGWGFLQEDGTWRCGSTENTGPRRWVPPGEDTTFWTKVCRTEEEMLDEMRREHWPRPGQPNAYDAYRQVVVGAPDPEQARRRAEDTRLAGYNLLDNNCLHHARAILLAYGVPEDEMASPITHPGPNAWFAASFGEVPTVEL